jgi:hypothetical protein
MRRLIWRVVSVAVVGWLFGAHGVSWVVGQSPLGQMARANPAAVRAGCEAMRKELAATPTIVDRLPGVAASAIEFVRRRPWFGSTTRPCARVVR